MKLVDTDADRPDDETEPVPTVLPSVPEKRRATASLLLTAMILTGTVVTIYTVFPARHDEVAAVAVAEHRRAEPEWQLESPDARELSVWAIALLGSTDAVPAPAPGLEVIGVRAVEVVGRRAAFLHYRVDDVAVSLLCQRARDVPPRRKSWRNGTDAVESWRTGKFTCVAVGPAASADAWRPRLGVP